MCSERATGPWPGRWLLYLSGEKDGRCCLFPGGENGTFYKDDQRSS